MQISFDQNITGKLISGLGQTAQDQPVEIQLKGNNVVRMERTDRAVTIRGTGGVLWITQEGNSEDYILQGGDAVTLSRGGVIVVQALGCGRMQVINAG